MKEKIEKEIKSLDRKINRLNCMIESNISSIRDDINSSDIDRIISSKNDLDKLEKDKIKLNQLIEQKETLEYLITVCL